MNGYFTDKLLHYCNISTKSCTRINSNIISFYDFTFVLEGTMIYIINGERYILKKNDGIFLPPGTLRERIETHEYVKYISFNFSMIDEQKLDFDIFMPKCISENIRKLIGIYPYSHLSDIPRSQEKCANMLNYILLELTDYSEMSSNNTHIIKLINYINLNIHHNITLADLSSHTNLSREYICYLFKKEMNQTVTDYINNIRLNMAKELIITNEMPLSDISAFVGFENYNYFSRLFKRKFGTTPIYLKKQQLS